MSTVSQGVVTRSGSVDDRWGKRLAEDIAERVPGVRDVMNHLRVGDQTGSRGRQVDMGSSGSTSQDMTRTETTTPGSKSQGANGRRATTPTR